MGIVYGVGGWGRVLNLLLVCLDSMGFLLGFGFGWVTLKEKNLYLTQIHPRIQVPNLLISNPPLTVEFGKSSHSARVFTALSCDNNVKSATTMVFRFVSLSVSKFVMGLSVFMFLFVFELCGFRLDFSMWVCIYW